MDLKSYLQTVCLYTEKIMISYEDAQLLDDPKYRQYANAVEKVLRSFESSSEWADLISALGKLNKVRKLII